MWKILQGDIMIRHTDLRLWDNAMVYDDWLARQADPDFVMRYTGFKDMHGIPIYENDIVYRQNSRKYNLTQGYAFVVEYNENMEREGCPCDLCTKAYRRSLLPGFQQLEHMLSDLEITGNIYENPEQIEACADAAGRWICPDHRERQYNKRNKTQEIEEDLFSVLEQDHDLFLNQEFPLYRKYKGQDGNYVLDPLVMEEWKQAAMDNLTNEDSKNEQIKKKIQKSLKTKKDSTNPKDLLGVKKPPLSLIPPSAIVEEAMAFKEGAAKYGRYNWRSNKVQLSIYVDAALRHLMAFFDGEDIDPDSGLPHEAKVKACMSILIDARNTGNLIDDRPTAGTANKTIKRYTNE